MQSNVFSLEVKEFEMVQPEAIEILKGSLGPAPSRNVVERAVFEIGDRLRRVQLALKKGDLDDVGKLAGGLVAICAQIGLSTLSRVAQDLVDCVRRLDYVAIAATFKRLIRLSESALYSAVAYTDRTI